MRKRAELALSVLVWAVLLVGNGPAWAQSAAPCADPRIVQIQDQAPNLLMVVDQSSSMTSNTIVVDGVLRTLWDVVEQIVRDISSWSHEPGLCVAGSSPRSCDRVRMGLHFWSDAKRGAIVPAEGTTAGAIEAVWGSAIGSTQLHQGAQQIRDEAALRDSERANVAIFLTDGKADNAWTTRQAVRILCEVQRDPVAPVATYAVGFGNETHGALDALLGASGGTRGTCCRGVGCSLSNLAQLVDPCAYHDHELAQRDALVAEFEALLSPGELANFQALYQHLTTFNPSARTDSSLYGSPSAWRAVDHKIDVALDYALFLGWDETATTLTARRDWLARMHDTLSWVIRHDYSSSSWERSNDGLHPADLSAYLELRAEDDGSTHLHPSFTCGGGITATSAHELQTALQGILGSLQCTFPLNLLSEAIAAPEPTSFTHVRLDLPSFGLLTIPHVSDATGQRSLVDQIELSGLAAAYTPPVDEESADGDFSNDGWDWANPGRTAVQLTGDVCALIAADFVTSVETKVCEPCSNVGQICDVPGGVGRCGQGVITCDTSTGTATCSQLMRPMPEICNGVDDDCDGQVDDLARNREDWSAARWSLGALQSSIDTDPTHPLPKPRVEGYDCAGRDACGCRDNHPDDYGGLGETEAEEFESFLVYHATHRSYCGCGEGLSVEPTAAVDPAVPEAQQPACAAGAAHLGGGAAAGTAALGCVLIGLLGLRRRRRR